MQIVPSFCFYPRPALLKFLVNFRDRQRFKGTDNAIEVVLSSFLNSVKLWLDKGNTVSDRIFEMSRNDLEIIIDMNLALYLKPWLSGHFHPHPIETPIDSDTKNKIVNDAANAYFELFGNQLLVDFLNTLPDRHNAELIVKRDSRGFIHVTPIYYNA